MDVWGVILFLLLFTAAMVISALSTFRHRRKNMSDIHSEYTSEDAAPFSDKGE